jgi:hypothetical protein
MKAPTSQIESFSGLYSQQTADLSLVIIGRLANPLKVMVWLVFSRCLTITPLVTPLVTVLFKGAAIHMTKAANYISHAIIIRGFKEEISSAATSVP